MLFVSSQAWGAARKVSKDDWLEWLRRLSVVLLKESSSPALRSCWSLAQTYIPLARYTTSIVVTLPALFLLPLFHLNYSFSFCHTSLMPHICDSPTAKINPHFNAET